MESKYTNIIPLTTIEINDLSLLLEENEIQIYYEYSTLINLGYRCLSNSEKMVYLYMKNIADTNYNLTKKSICRVKLDYLAIIFDSTIKTQKNNINTLIHYDLISKNKEGYTVYNPIIESSFKETIYKLVYRKKLKTIEKYITLCKNMKERQEYMDDLRFLTKKDEEFPYLKEITTSFNLKRVEKFI